MCNYGNYIVAAANALIGKPYVWGGESDAEGGYDCSGLVYASLNKGGISVSRDTAQGYYNRFKKNTSNKNVAGALVFFGKSTISITHVGICTGDGVHMIESIGSKSNTINNKGKGVTLSYISRRKDLVAICTPFKCSYIKPVIANYTQKIGSKGTQVNFLQQDLNYAIDAGLDVDGRFGQLTKAAVCNFQIKYGLVSDGIYGPKTFNKMREVIG